MEVGQFHCNSYMLINPSGSGYDETDLWPVLNQASFVNSDENPDPALKGIAVGGLSYTSNIQLA